MPDDRAQRPVAIVGGGWAGMAAAVRLVEAGVPVTVFEAGPVLGGRARRIDGDDIVLDNGQHLLLGAYRRTLALIHQVQPAVPAATLYDRRPLALDGPGAFRLHAAPLPAPLHMLGGLLRARDCTWTERWAVVRAFTGWQRAGWRAPRGATVADLLRGQPTAIADRLWIPLCLAALNTPSAAASAQVFLNVLRDALAAGRADSDLVLPRADLSALFPEPAGRYVEERGGTVHRGLRVRGLRLVDGGVAIACGEASLGFGRVILATAPRQAARLLGSVPAAAPARDQMAAYAHEPITTVYLRFALPLPPGPPLRQLAGGPGQWLFDRSATVPQGALLAVVISADGPHRQLPHATLADVVLRQLGAQLPLGAALAVPQWTRVITERHATWACRPDQPRPAAGLVAPGLVLAGDHTDPDYPATLEAAVRSGERAAAAILADR